MGCDAADRNAQALHELELQWGAGRLDYGRLRAILTGDCDRHEPLQEFLNDPEGRALVNAIHQRKRETQNESL